MKVHRKHWKKKERRKKTWYNYILTLNITSTPTQSQRKDKIVLKALKKQWKKKEKEVFHLHREAIRKKVEIFQAYFAWA